jgi:hypothetical protein
LRQWLPIVILGSAPRGRDDEIVPRWEWRTRWAEQTIRGAFPKLNPQVRRAPPRDSTRTPADRARTLRELADLHQRGVLTDDEFGSLRAGLAD